MTHDEQLRKLNERVDRLEDSDTAHVVGLLIERIELLEKQMENLIGHFNELATVVQRLEWQEIEHTGETRPSEPSVGPLR